MAGLAHLDGEVAVGRMVARAGDPAAAGDLGELGPVIGPAAGDVQADEPLARFYIIDDSVLCGLGQFHLGEIGGVLPPGVEHQCVIAGHGSRVGQHRGILGCGHVVTCRLEESLQYRRGLFIRVPSASDYKQLHVGCLQIFG